MKHFVIFLALAVFVAAKDLTPEEKHEREVLSKKCEDSSKVTAAVLDKLKEGVYENDQALKKYLLCIQRDNGFQDESGNIHPEILKPRWGGHIPDDVIEKVVKNCAVKKETPEETAWQFAKCARSYTHGSKN